MGWGVAQAGSRNRRLSTAGPGLVKVPGRRMKRMRALVIDDEKNIRATLTMCLEGMGAEVSAVATGEAALAALAREPCEIAFLDLRLGADSGLDLIPLLLAQSPGLTIVVVTAYATIDTAVEAIRRGARDYLPKPFSPAEIRHRVEQDAERRALGSRIRELEGRVADLAPEADLSSLSPKMVAALEIVTRAARSDASVLFAGESG